MMVAVINSGGLSFLPSGVHNRTDTQTSAGTMVLYRLSVSINLDGVVEITKASNA
jgi:hypothetical protein